MTVKEKELQRRNMLARRDQMSAEERARLSLALIAHAEALAVDPRGTIISAFLPIRSEIDARPLMARLRAKGARLALPALLDTKRQMEFRLFDEQEDLVAMDFGTSGPGSTAPVVDPDIILLPLAAYDGRGNRIGYGGGNYDCTIAAMRARGLAPKLVGLAFSCQEIAAVAAEPHDIKLEAILTEKGLKQFSLT